MEKRLLQAHSTTDLTKCEELWFEDGNIVIQAENTLFKVHRGILRAQSSVFADMFSFPQSAQQDERYEECPLVRLYDSVEELTFFLKGVVDSSTFASRDKPTYDQVIAFARLGTKYNVRHIRAYGLRILRQAYPLPLDQFEVSHARPFTGAPLTTFATINLARELDILDILPASFVRIFGIHPSIIIHGTAEGLQLNQEDKLFFLAGREALSNAKWRVHTFLTKPAKCNSSVSCNTARLQCVQQIAQSSFHPFSRPAYKEGLCTECTRNWHGSMEERRRELWDEIPKMFNLPNMDALREMRERGETEEA